MRIERGTAESLEDWVRLRHALWPKEGLESLSRNAVALLARLDAVVFLLHDESGRAIGFAEATVRHDPVNGCETSPVAFLEGIYIDPAYRRRGAARRLFTDIRGWAAARGLSEIGSDALLDNPASHAMHRALGFAEIERVVCYRTPVT
jgi:aminoglycoside 6'-N-acetyltransferase I